MRLKKQKAKSKKKSFFFLKKLTFFNFERKLPLIGFIFLFLGSLILLLTFYPVLKEELRYQTKKIKNRLKIEKFIPEEIKPVDENFSLVIPKIFVNSRVIANVDPFDSKIYQKALIQGVAHAKGSALPDVVGNTFIFSHSSSDWYTANRYNSVFYLLNKLKKGDEIYLYYQKQKYRYRIIKKLIVSPESVEYLKGNQNKKTLTLMTCWPPGSDLKRLLIIADLIF